MHHAHAAAPMRRSKQQLSPEECRAVLERGTSGVLALKGGPDGFPYAVPLSYVYVPADDAETAAEPAGERAVGDGSVPTEAPDAAAASADRILCDADCAASAAPDSAGIAAEASGSLFFHCAKTGFKLDMLAQDDRVSFCVVDQDRVVPEKFTTYYRSVIAFGRLRVVDDRERALAATRALGRKYNPGQEEALEQELSSGFPRMLVLELAVDALTGKQAKELVSR